MRAFPLRYSPGPDRDGREAECDDDKRPRGDSINYRRSVGLWTRSTAKGRGMRTCSRTNGAGNRVDRHER